MRLCKYCQPVSKMPTITHIRRVCNQINTTGATSGAGTAYLSGTPEFTPGFQWGSYYSIFSFTSMFLNCCLFFFLWPLCCLFQQYFSYIMATSFSGGRSRSTRREPPTMGKQLVNFITCGCGSSASFFVSYPRRIGDRLV